MGKTGEVLGHIRSLGLWLSLPEVVQSHVDADEVAVRHADATVGNCLASGLIIVLTSRVCRLNWGVRSLQALRRHIGS